MRVFFALAVAVGAAVAVSGQSTIPPVVMPPTTTPVGPVRPPQKPPLTVTPKAGPAAEISGRVVDDGSRGIGEATVWLVGQTSIQRAVTDARGRFLFNNVASGEYVAVARKRGFYDGAFGKRRANGSPLPFSAGAGQATSDMQIELFRSGVIVGSVFDEANEPVVGARVIAIRRFFAGGDWRFFPAGSVTTDDQGMYRVYGLEPGEYIVTTPTAQLNVEVPDEPLSAGGVPFTESPDQAYPTVYYATTRYSLLSLPVTIGSGEIRYAVNFQWAPVPARAVSGRLTGFRELIGGQVVKLVPIDTREVGIANEAAVTISAPDGTFFFERVPAGEYRLEAGGAFGPPRTVDVNFPDGSNPPPEVFWGRERINVIDEDVKNVVVEMQTGRGVNGTISAPAGVQWARVSIAIVPAIPGLARATAPPVANGRFLTVPLIPGDYFVRITGLPPGIYLEGITVGGKDALDGAVELGSVEDQSIRVVLTDRPTTITGAVRDARMLPASGAAILVLPAASSEWSPNRSRQTRASMNGQFTVAGLPAGDYIVVAIDDAFAEGLQDERWIAQLRTLGTRVSLKQQESRTVQLRLSTVKR
ncbi:MAG TPA: carboxypeptidase-like regulatory domain-containing protein [Vicinamibacterales bacterium]|nr:carboxypeptidase-like regulatory domain-containing protein [Vicinamibacterales bacterium]